MLEDITPSEFRCPPFPGCPAIFRSDRGTVVVIGRRVPSTDLPAPLGEGGAAVEVPAELLTGLTRE